MHVLITGGAGFIGTHVALRLMGRGDSVVLLDDFSSLVYPAQVKEERMQQMFTSEERPKLITGSVLDRDLVETLFQEEEFDAVLHLAAHANPGASMNAPDVYALVNIMGTLVILDAAARHSVGRFVFAGSSSVYSDEQVPFREDSYPLRPRSPYGASKAAAEVYCSLWHDLHGLPVTVLRLFSVYGPWGRPDMAPMIFTDAVVQGRELVLTEDERQRDFTYIDDAVDGIEAALDRQFDFEVINIGRGQPVRLPDFLGLIERAADKQAQVAKRPAPPGEMHVTYADISKAKDLLGYAPRVSAEEGVERLVSWVASRKR